MINCTRILVTMLFSVAGISFSNLAHGQNSVLPDTTHTPLTSPQGIRWLRLMGGSKVDVAAANAGAPDGGLLITGTTSSPDHDFFSDTTQSSNIFVTRLSADGVTLWTRILQGSKYESPLSVIRTSGGDWLISGYTSSHDLDFEGADGILCEFLLRMNDEGEIMNLKLFNDTLISFIKPIATNDNGCVFQSKLRDSAGIAQQVLVKVDVNSKIEWIKIPPIPIVDPAAAVMPDNSYWMVGYKSGYDSTCVFKLIHFNTSGDVMAIDSFQLAPTGGMGVAVDFQLLPSRFGGLWLGILALANNDPNEFGIHGSGSPDIGLLRIDDSGHLLWKRFYGGSQTEHLSEFVEQSDGSIIFAGSTYSKDGNISKNYGGTDGWIAMVDSGGDLRWQQSIGASQYENIASISLSHPTQLNVVGSYTTIGNFFKDTFGLGDIFIARLDIGNSISGQVFWDENGNNIRDAGERRLTNLMISSQKGSARGSMSLSGNGQYSMIVDTGDFRTTVQINPAYFSINPSPALSHFDTYGLSDTIDFAISSLTDTLDLSMQVTALRPARPGRDFPILLRYKNQGTKTVAGAILQLFRDSLQQIISSSPSATVLANDTLQWTLGTLQPFDTGSVYVLLHNAMPPELDAGDTLKLWATLSGDSLADATPDDNIVQFAMPVTNSFDPNDKSEKHGGRLSPQQAAGRDWLEYTIRFQNTGTDTAFRVIVSDSLEARLDPKTVEVIAASHPCDFTIENDRILKWTFNDILLPDSNRNEPASHGYVLFRIRPKAGLNAGDSISNYAGIWFDFNAPVYTGRQWTKVTVTGVTAVDNLDPLARRIKFYPIPGRETTWMEASGITATRMGLQLYDLQGRLMYSADLGPQSGGHFRRPFDWTRLPAGLYVIVVQVDRKTVSYKLLLE